MPITHGLSRTIEYRVWQNMMARCYKPNNKKWDNYGGRGIKVGPEMQTIEGFIKVLGKVPPGLTIDRIDNDGNYESGNVRWAPRKTQMRNRSDNVHVTYNGRTQTMADWAEEIGISLGTLWYRLRKKKWTIEKALTAPLMSMQEASQLGHAARWGK